MVGATLPTGGGGAKTGVGAARGHALLTRIGISAGAGVGRGKKVILMG